MAKIWPKMAIFYLWNTGISQFSIPEFGIEFNTGIPEFGIGIGCPTHTFYNSKEIAFWLTFVHVDDYEKRVRHKCKVMINIIGYTCICSCTKFSNFLSSKHFDRRILSPFWVQNSISQKEHFQNDGMANFS